LIPHGVLPLGGVKQGGAGKFSSFSIFEREYLEKVADTAIVTMTNS